MKKICPKCGIEVSAQNYSRHLNRCDGNGFGYYIKQDEPDSLDCPYCGKTCKNLNSFRQHSVRCKNNSNRKSYNNFSKYIEINRKGKTADNCPEIAKQVATMKKKYAEGFVNPTKGRKIIVEYLYEEHNSNELQKWFDWLNTQDLSGIKYLPVENYLEGYELVKDGNKWVMQQNYIMKQIMGNDFVSTGTVHHINRNRSDNSVMNLCMFVDSTNHKRFHNSEYAYLTYDEQTHLFSCELKRN